MPRQLFLVAALLALSSAPLFAGVIVVDKAGGGAFTQIAAAVAAAAEGDTILVKPITDGSSYASALVDGKSLSIVRDAPAGSPFPVAVVVSIDVRHLAAGQQVVLRGIGMNRTLLADNAGSVWMEDCTLQGSAGSGGGIFNCFSIAEFPGTPALTVTNCASVTLLRSTLQGGDGSAGEDHGTMAFSVSTDGGAGLLASASDVALHECALKGGRGGAGMVVCDHLGDGAPGLNASASAVLLSGCTVSGGAAGNGLPGNGVAADAASSIQTLDSLVTAAPGGIDFHVVPGTLVTYAGAARSLALTSPLREGQAGTLSLMGVQGDFVGFFWAFDSGFQQMPARNGWFLLKSPFVAGPFLIGAITASSGQWSIPMTGPALPAALQAQTFLLQAWFQYPGGVTLGSGSAFTLVDGSL